MLEGLSSENLVLGVSYSNSISEMPILGVITEIGHFSPFRLLKLTLSSIFMDYVMGIMPQGRLEGY